MANATTHVPTELRRTKSSTLAWHSGGRRTLAIALPPLRRCRSVTSYDQLLRQLDRNRDRNHATAHQPLCYDDLLAEFEIRTRTHLPVGYNRLRENIEAQYARIPKRREPYAHQYRRSISVDWSHDPLRVINWRTTLDPGYRKTFMRGFEPTDLKYGFQLAQSGAIDRDILNNYYMKNGLCYPDEYRTVNHVPSRISDHGFESNLDAIADAAERRVYRSSTGGVAMNAARDQIRRGLLSSQMQAQYWQDERDAQIGNFSRSYLDTLHNAYAPPPRYTTHPIRGFYQSMAIANGRRVYVTPPTQWDHYYASRRVSPAYAVHRSQPRYTKYHSDPVNFSRWVNPGDNRVNAMWLGTSTWHPSNAHIKRARRLYDAGEISKDRLYKYWQQPIVF